MRFNKIFFLLFYQILLFSIIFIILNTKVAFGCVSTPGNTVISSDCTGNYNAFVANDTLTVNSGITMTGTANFFSTNTELLNNGTITDNPSAFLIEVQDTEVHIY